MYPLLAVVEALEQRAERPQVLYLGSAGGIEESIVKRAGLSYRAVEAGQVRGVGVPGTLRSLRAMWRGYRQGRRALSEWKAQALLVTGGYVSVPVALAARRQGVPFMVYLPDLEPGWAVRLLAYFADRVAVSFAQVRDRFPARVRRKVWVSGYPVRAALLNADRAAGRAELGLDQQLKTLLVFGGSRGARSINRALVSCLAELTAHCQVIHISGRLDWPWVADLRAGLSAKVRARYRAYPYLHEEMSAAMAAADLVVARAGAATLGEFPAVGLPAVLVPYPYAGQHQGLNADFMVERGAAVRVDDADLERELLPVVVHLLRDDETLMRMRERARAIAVPDAAHRLAEELCRMAGDDNARPQHT